MKLSFDITRSQNSLKLRLATHVDSGNLISFPRPLGQHTCCRTMLQCPSSAMKSHQAGAHMKLLHRQTANIARRNGNKEDEHEEEKHVRRWWMNLVHFEMIHTITSQHFFNSFFFLFGFFHFAQRRRKLSSILPSPRARLWAATQTRNFITRCRQRPENVMEWIDRKKSDV